MKERMRNLFQLGDYTLHSGMQSNFKIDCDALTNADWDTLAYLACKKLKLVGTSPVVPIPTGGIKFAEAIQGWMGDSLNLQDNDVLVVDDVLTTGASFETAKEALIVLGWHPDNIIGVVAFARGQCPNWVHPIFQM